MRRSYFYLLSCCVLAAFVAVSCDANKGRLAVEDGIEQTEDQPGAGEQVETDNNDAGYNFYAEGAPSVMSADDQKKVAAVNSFAFSFANELQKKEENGSFVFSPVSLGCLLGMLSEGADGESRAEICNALGFDASDQAGINEFFRNLIVLSAAAEGTTEELSMANVVVADNHFSFVEQFKQNIAGYYDGGFKNMDFSDGKAVADFVNGWAAQHTNGRINKVVDEVHGVLCLANALYFKGNWSYPFFKEATSDKLFTAADNTTRQVKMMYKRDDATGAIQYCDMGDFRMVNLKYGNPAERSHRYSISVLLPGQGKTVEDVLSGLTAESWASSLEKVRAEYVNLSLPSFCTDSNIDSDNLKILLGNMGIKQVFDPQRADFSNLTAADVYVEIIKHLANISVDEDGTEAAAVSFASLDFTSPGPGAEQPQYIEFNCNRPFVYAISDSRTGAILTLGCYR